MTDFADFLKRKHAFSLTTFGPGLRTKGISAHIKKELEEIAAHPTDLEEWVDVTMLAVDGYMRAGGDPDQLLPDLEAKLKKNQGRDWPAITSEDIPMEHVRSEEEVAAKKPKRSSMNEVDLDEVTRNVCVYIAQGLMEPHHVKSIQNAMEYAKKEAENAQQPK